MNEDGYGNTVNLYRAVGELAGITSLVDTFYANMGGRESLFVPYAQKT
jgi:truncated hemoglobin YjbI